FFQAEDGIRDGHVTGVQTCALPIFERMVALAELQFRNWSGTEAQPTRPCAQARDPPHRVDVRSSRVEERASQRSKIGRHCPSLRSEERRVGKECMSNLSQACI